MKVIIATDGTGQSAAALDAAGFLKLGPDDELHIITIVDMALPLSVDLYAGQMPSTDELEKSVVAAARRNLHDAHARLQAELAADGPRLSTELLYGSPESRIVEKAEEFGADLIVVGSHGYNRWERLLLGSVSDSVIHHAPCSVLVVRERRAQ